MKMKGTINNIMCVCMDLPFWIAMFYVLIRDSTAEGVCSVNVCDQIYPKCPIEDDVMFIHPGPDSGLNGESVRLCQGRNKCGEENRLVTSCYQHNFPARIRYSCVSGSSYKDILRPLEQALQLNKTANFQVFVTAQTCSDRSIFWMMANQPFVIGLKQFKRRSGLPGDCSAVTLEDIYGGKTNLPDKQSTKFFVKVNSTQKITVNCMCVQMSSSLWITMFEFPESCHLEDALMGRSKSDTITQEDVPLAGKTRCDFSGPDADISIPTCKTSRRTSSARPLTTSTPMSPTKPSSSSKTIPSTRPGHSTSGVTEGQWEANVTRRPDTNSKPSAGKDTTIILASAVAAGILLVALIVVIVFISWRRHKIRVARKSAGHDDQREITGDISQDLNPILSTPLTPTDGQEENATYSNDNDSSVAATQVTQVDSRHTYDVIGVEPGSPAVAVEMTSSSDGFTYDKLQIPKVKRMPPLTDETVGRNDVEQSAVYSDCESRVTARDSVQHEVIDGCEYAVVQK